MNQKLKLAVLVIVIVIAIGFMIKQFQPKKISTPPDTVEEILVDVKANKLFLKSVKIGTGAYPTTSPFSEGNNAYLAVQCADCKALFAVQGQPPMEGPFDLEIWTPACPVCGSKNFLPKPEFPAGKKSVDLPGPVHVVKLPLKK
ncbi:MAG: hypothetical protein JW957_04200 [Candidatus Omnitrophica bacterium]|nr:hypothetical protein [Candidatus Omnitrophota bacterium]